MSVLNMKAVAVMVLGAVVCLGATVPSTDKPVVSQAQVDEWTKVWQKRLDLNEWTISTLIVRVGELRPDTLGNLKWNSGNRTAVIKVLNPADYELPSSEIPTDIEYTIVHEMIHLQLAALPHDGSSKGVEEKIVNRISEALFQFEKGDAYKPRATVAKTFVKSSDNSEAARSKSKP